MLLINPHNTGPVEISGAIYSPDSNGIYTLPDHLVTDSIYRKGFVSAHEVIARLNADQANTHVPAPLAIPEPIQPTPESPKPAAKTQ